MEAKDIFSDELLIALTLRVADPKEVNTVSNLKVSTEKLKS